MMFVLNEAGRFDNDVELSRNSLGNGRNFANNMQWLVTDKWFDVYRTNEIVL